MRDFRRLLGLMRPYQRLSLLAVLTLVLLAAVDLAIPRLIQRIIDVGIRENDRSVVLVTAGVMFLLTLLSGVLSIVNNVLSVRVGEGIARDLRRKLFTRIQRFSFRDLDRQHTGQLLVRLTSDVSAVRGPSQISLRIGTRAPLMMLGSLVLMFTTSYALALAVLPLLLLTCIFIGYFVTRMGALFRVAQQRLDALNGVLHENVTGVRLVKAVVRADFEGQRFESANETLTESSIKVAMFMSTMAPILAMCVNAGVVIVIWFGGLQSIKGQLSLGQIVAFTNYLFMTMGPLVMMTGLSNIWAAGLVSSKRTAEILDTVPDVQDAPGAVDLDAAGGARLVFDDVSFAYGAEPILQNLSLDVGPGDTLAIVGSTGAGKSTLVNLIPRFYDVTSGRVLVGGRDVRETTERSLVSAIGIVPQATILFSGTVRDNIRYGRPDASDEEVIAAAGVAQAHDFVVKLAQGYDTHVEERGTNLSGGQKQRIAIARALLIRPKILILDDATSAIDVETESKIQDALAATAGERITVLVAQRISSVVRADKIVVLENGRMIASGTHPELMRSSNVYREIYDSQLGTAVAS
jgi:ATP-binding cassette subfamily B multidrug efflux pump